MSAHPLDNPIWAALQSEHARFATGDAEARRYPRPVAPFGGVATSGVPSRSVAALLEDNAAIYFIGPLPARSDRWNVELEASVVQMTCPSAATLAAPPPEYRELLEPDIDAMLALSTLVFPGYFRERTLSMGRYLGIFADDVLVAMAGERMCLDGYRELSAVCTRPGFTGRGYAGMLVSTLARSMMARAIVPFLHVSPDNQRARGLYRSLGFVERCELPLIRISAASSSP